MCKDCNGTGIAIVILDDTADTGIQCCDTCQKLTDAEAIDAVKALVFKIAKSCTLV